MQDGCNDFSMATDNCRKYLNSAQCPPIISLIIYLMYFLVNLNAPISPKAQTQGITFLGTIVDAPIYGPNCNSPKFAKVRYNSPRGTKEAAQKAVMENKNFDKRNYLDVYNRDVKLRNLKLNVNSRKNSSSFRNTAGKVNYNTLCLNSARSLASAPQNPE